MRFFKAVDGCTIYLEAIIANIIAQLCVALPITILQSYINNTKILSFVNVLAMIVIQAMFFLVFYHYLKKNKVTPQFQFYKVRPSSIILTVILGIVTLATFLAHTIWFAIFLGKIGYKFNNIFILDSIPTIILAFIVVVGISPICEELIFRCALLSGLRERLGEGISMILSGLAFAFMHMNPEQTIYQFCLGCVCAYVVMKNASILPAIILHSTSNLLAFILELIPFDVTDFIAQWFLSHMAIGVVVSLAVFIAGLALVFIITRKIKKIESRVIHFENCNTNDDAESSADVVYQNGGILGKNTYKVFYVCAMLICIFMWSLTFIMSMI